MKDCKKCKLYKTRKNVVIGEGSLNAKIVFIGEAPGKNEDETGVPFCGRAGKLLDEFLSSINLKREDIFITNIVKCRPSLNRDPDKEEIKICSNYLEKQIKEINPEIICPLGRYASKFILKKYGFEEKEIGKVHGVIFENKVKIIPMYHPAAAIYDPKKKDIIKTDFKKILN